MKCSVCGYNAPEGKEYCPLCGSKLAPAQQMSFTDRGFDSFDSKNTVKPIENNSADFTWNTYDFPKPKAFRDITMDWSTADFSDAVKQAEKPKVTFEKEDNSFGFVKEEPKISFPKEEPKVSFTEPKEYPSFEAPKKPEPEVTEENHGNKRSVWLEDVKASDEGTEGEKKEHSKFEFTLPDFDWNQKVDSTIPAKPVQNVTMETLDTMDEPKAEAEAPVEAEKPEEPAEEILKAEELIEEKGEEDENFDTKSFEAFVFNDHKADIPAAPAPEKAESPVLEKTEVPAPEKTEVSAPEITETVSAKEPEELHLPVFHFAPAAKTEPEEMPETEEITAPEDLGIPSFFENADKAEDLIKTKVIRPLESTKIYESSKAETSPQTEAKAPADFFDTAEEGDENVNSEWISSQLGSHAFTLRTDEEPQRRPEQFFTFQRKNEEFQKLLDAEYARIKGQSNGPAQEAKHVVSAGDLGLVKEALREMDAKEEKPIETVQSIVKAEETAHAERVKNEEEVRSAALDALFGSAPRKEPEAPAVKEEPKAESPEPKTSGNVYNSDAYRALEERIAKLQKELQERQEAIANANAAIAAASANQQDPWKAQELAEKSVQGEETAPEAAPVTSLEKEKEPAALEEPKDTTGKGLTEEDEKTLTIYSVTDAAAKTRNAKDTKELTGDEGKEIIKRTVDDFYDVDEDPEEKRRGIGPLGGIFLAILIVAGLFEGTVWGMNRFMPDSAVTTTVTMLNDAIIDAAEEGFHAAKSKVYELMGKEEPVVSKIDADGVNFGNVVAESNKNIKKVVRDTNLVVTADSKCNFEDLQTAAVVEDAAVKEALFKTMIGYNSSWIDYVNNVDSSCLSYFKADGAAYRGAVNYDKVGKISETFNELALGEVRQAGNFYYVLTHESISITENNATASSSYSMAYKLEKIGDDYKIADYSSFTK